MRSAASLLILGGVGAGIYLHSHHALRIATAQADSGVPKINSTPAATQVVASPEPAARAPVSLRQQNGAHAASSTQPAATASVTDPSAPVQVSLTAHARAWIQLIVDGKTTFTGTMNANETRAVSAMEQVHLLTGNAGALTVSLNGKTLDPLGGFGEQREVRLTAEGPQFLTKDPPPAPDQL